MGFRATPQLSAKPKMLLIASLAEANINLADYTNGADALLLPIARLGRGAKTLKRITQSIDIPWGGWLEDTSGGEIRPLLEAGCDFIVFPADTPLAIPQDELGRILQIEASLSEGLLRTLNELPIDAVLIPRLEEEYFLTWRHLMLFQHFADLLTKPLLVSLPQKVEANELQFLWKIGVDGVIVEVGEGEPRERVGELRRIIDHLTLPARKRGRLEPLLPRISEEITLPAEEEEEE